MADEHYEAILKARDAVSRARDASTIARLRLRVAELEAENHELADTFDLAKARYDRTILNNRTAAGIIDSQTRDELIATFNALRRVMVALVGEAGDHAIGMARVVDASAMRNALDVLAGVRRLEGMDPWPGPAPGGER